MNDSMKHYLDLNHDDKMNWDMKIADLMENGMSESAAIAVLYQEKV